MWGAGRGSWPGGSLAGVLAVKSSSLVLGGLASLSLLIAASEARAQAPSYELDGAGNRVISLSNLFPDNYCQAAAVAGRVAKREFDAQGKGPPGCAMVASRSCGQLSDPEYGGGDGDDGEVVGCGFLEARGDASELLEPAEAAFGEMSLGIEVSIERMLARWRWVVGDDGERAFAGDRQPEVVGVIGGIGDDDLRGEGAR